MPKRYEGVADVHETAAPLVRRTDEYVAAIARACRPVALAVIGGRQRYREYGVYSAHAESMHQLRGPIGGLATCIAVEDFRPGARLNPLRPVRETSVEVTYARGETGQPYNCEVSTDGTARSDLVHTTDLASIVAPGPVLPLPGRGMSEVDRQVNDKARSYVSNVASALLTAAVVDASARACGKPGVVYPEGAVEVVAGWSSFSSPDLVHGHLRSVAGADLLLADGFPVPLGVRPGF